jgi:hypothetical protein
VSQAVAQPSTHGRLTFRCMPDQRCPPYVRADAAAGKIVAGCGVRSGKAYNRILSQWRSTITRLIQRDSGKHSVAD